MAALIETFTYAEGTAAPWWNTGLAGTDAKTWEEFQKAAGLDWEVKKIPLFWQKGTDEERHYVHQKEGFAIQRQADENILGIVGPQYTPIQNETVFQWFNPWIEGGLARFETAGALKNGKVVFALATVVGMEGNVKARDMVRRHILLSNSHDGSTGILNGTVDTRVVCANTLAAARQEGTLGSVRHTKSAEATLQAAQRAMTTLLEQFNEDLLKYKRLAETPAPAPKVEQYVKRVFDLPLTDEEKLTKRAEAMVTDIMVSFQSGIGNQGETWWDAYNGVTQYLTHSRGKDAEKRQVSNWFGDSAQKNKKALALAYELAAI